MRLRLVHTIILLFPVFFIHAQKLKKADKITIANLQKHVSFLADDKLEGRRAGTNGETLAMNYISNEFATIGLLAKGTDNFYQSFPINDGKQINPGTYFFINKKELGKETDYFPLPFSANATINAEPALSLQEADMPWFLNLKETLEDNNNNPHFDVIEFIKAKANDAKKKGATAFIVYNTSTIDDPHFEAKDRSEVLSIPVVFVTKKAAATYFKDLAATLIIKLKTDIGVKQRTGHNVIGYIDNGSANTVILGAHFDHLGYGEDGGSLLRTNEHLIHNGADDNASGVAALIELARMLKNSKVKNSNFLFIAFSGEELGLFGSKYFADNPTVDLKAVNYMINMDMVGRFNDSTHALTIGGYGTSPTWSTAIAAANPKAAFVIRIDSSGIGPSDHTSFYMKDIPVLFFFTGLHSDYHKPTDDADKINYTGEYKVVRYIDDIITSLDKQNQKLTFLKTKDNSTNAPRFSVTLGIMPDYTFTGTGVRCDGISEGKAAQKAGLQTGDIIVQLGDNNVTSLDNYMQALGKFKKGDKTKVKYKRGNEVKESDVQF